MKVVMLIRRFWPDRIGGAERQCAKISAQLVQQGVRVVVVTSRPSFKAIRHESFEGFEVFRCGRFGPLRNFIERWRDNLRDRLDLKEFRQFEENGLDVRQENRGRKKFRFLWLFRYLDNLAFLWETKHAIACIKPDVLHVHETHWIAGVGAWVARSLHIPCICKECTYPPFAQFGNDVPFAEFWQRMRGKCDAYVVLSPESALQLEKMKVPRERLFIIPNGVDLPDIKLRTPEESFVLCVANLHQDARLKGFDTLIDAWSIVYRFLPQSRLVVAGSGNPLPWETRARKLGCQGTIQFPGFVDDVSKLYTKASLFVLPSRVEGMSNALLEAQSWGIPAVATDIPGNRAVIQRGSNGILVPVNDPTALASAIVEVLRDPAKRLAMGMAARKIIESKFSIDKVARCWVEAYQSLIQKNRSRS